MLQSIKVAERIIRIGDRLRGNMNAPERGLCREGDIVTVVHIEDRDMIGLRSEKRLDGWGDLDGRVPARQGYWASRDCILDNFVPMGAEFVVNADVKHKKRNLKGMRCTILKDYGHGEYSFVELAEDVGGGSADGLGKAGHCVLVPAESLKHMPEEKKKPKSKKKEA